MIRDYVITTDNNSDLPESYYTEHGVGCTYLSYSMDGNHYSRDNFLPVKEFYDKMRLSSFPGNRVRQEAEEILKGGLANFDVESYKGYKSKFNDIYREEAYALLNVIIEMLG